MGRVLRLFIIAMACETKRTRWFSREDYNAFVGEYYCARDDFDDMCGYV